MNHNYMNYFNPGSSGGMSGVGGGSGTGNNNGLDYSNQSNFVGANMPSTGGSFMDMINSGGPPPMMNTPGQQMARYNHPYNNMYGSAGYAMESSAARLQQFARQMAPRHTGYNYSAQNSPEQMSQYYMQKMQMRMAQINSFHSQRYNNPIRMQSGWPRMMPDMPPHLPQLSAQQNRMNNMVANQNFLNSDLSPPLRMNNMQNITQQQPATMRKMPVLDEAPLSLREQAPFAQQSSGFNTQFGNQAFSSTLNNSIDTMTYSNTSSSLDINSTDNLPLSNITFQSSPRQKRQQPSQQLQQQPQQMQQPPQQLQQPPQPLQQQSQQLQQSPQQLQQASQQMQPAQQQSPNFLSSFAAELTAPLVVPQSPKLTHFGPSPGSVSSASSFEQPQLSTQQPSQIKPLPQQQQLPSPAPSITPATQTLSYTSSSPFSAQISQQNMPMSPLNSVEVSKPPQLSNNANMQQYFSKMANIQQQISQLKQGIQTPETSSQIAMLNQQYQIIFKQYEASKQQFKPTGLYNQNTKQIQQQMMSQSSPSPLSLTNVTSRLQQQSLKMQPPPLQQEKPQLIHQQQQQLSQQLPTIPQQQPMHNLSQHQLPQYQQAMQQMPNLQSSGIPKQPRQLRAQLPQQQQRQPNLNSFKTEPPTLSEVKPSPLDNISNSVLLDDIGDGLNIPDLDSFSKDFDTKSSSLFSAAIFGGSDILFGGDSLDVGTGIKSEDSKENTITPLQSFKNEESKSFQELSSTTTVLSSGDQKNSLHRNVMNNDSVFPMQQQSTLGQVFQTMTTPPKQQNSFPFPFNPNQFSNQPGNYPQIPQNILNSMSDLLNKNIPPSTNSNIGMPMLPGKPGMSSLPGMSTSSLPEPTKQKASKTKNKSGKGSGKAGGKGKAGRPLGSLNKKKKEGKAKKLPIELEPDDFDHIPPGEQLLNDFDESSMDPSLKRSLRERTKKKNYKDDFDYNLSEDEDGKKADLSKDSNTTEGETPVVPEPVITGGANQLLAYRPNLEAEGEIAIIEKILAMRSLQKEEVKEEEMETMVDEFFVKYKGYSYLHCEWGTVEQLAKKDKRVHAKVKRYKQKRDTSFAILNELDDEPFNPDYIEIDRVLDMQTTFDPVTQENINHFLVKWRALPYEDSTWELQMNIDESIIRHFHELKKPPPEEQRKFIPRPHESEWQKLNESPEYKNGNQLRDYQLEGLNWLTFCWHKRINCILADEMGLGKTVQSISLLCAMKKYGIAGPFLVIAPLSTIGNWQREFEEWTDINAIVYHGSLNSRNCIQQYEMHYKDENNENISQLYKFEAIITTYEIVLSANSFLCTIPFRCLIIDEAHRLKNQKCKLMEGLNNLKMEHRVLLTGTPLQNNVEELFSLLNFLEPTRFPSQGAFMYEFGNLKTEAQVDKLKQILKPMMLRRLKEDVETNIASKEETIVEVELTTIQKKFYRAILERNFSFLAKGAGYSNLPNLMNTMMELRKCCNHPFLIKGAEDKIVSEYLTGPDDPDKPIKQMKALIESSGKMVLIDKLLPKLKDGGHKVLVFSQMIKVLNLIEDYLLSKRYPFERIDGGVQGNMRQAAIDRFCRPDSDRFVFLLCTRAGGLGINLTAADTVIIFDSDWNPQNDLQAQARCHRIGQNKPVKVYRLICRNTYEREMFDRASLKLGLDKAVLQNINAKEGSSAGQQSMSKKEVEDLLKKGAYGAVMETDEDANKFCEEDIDQILQRRTQIIQIKGEGKGSTFSKASFVSDKAGIDVDLEDPDFWKKWAQKASVDINELEKDKKLIVDEPRKRKQTRRFGNDTDATVEMSDLDSDDETYEPYKTKKSANLGPIERAAWTRVECFKVEKLLLVYGWGRWQELISHAHFRQEVRHNDVEAISRTILAYCFRYYKTDEKSKQFFIDTIDESVKNAPPKNEKFDITNQILGSAPPPKSTRGRKRGGGNPGRNALRRLTHQYSKPALVECGIDWQTIDPEQLIIDAGYRKHLQHHCSKIMSRVRFLHSLQQDIIKEAATPILEGKPHAEIEISIPAMEGELPTIWWDEAADKSLLIGVFKHGYEKYRLIRNDPCLHFYDKLGPLQFNEKVPGSPDSIVNPSSIERSEDVASDSESVSSLKKKGKTKKDGDDEDSSIDSDEEKDIYSLNTSPASIVSTKEIVPACDIKLSNNPDTRWPLTTDLNTRLRRLFAAFTRSCEKEHNENIKAERDKIKQVRLANMVQERQRKKLEMQQRWTRREESDFYRVLSNFGVVTNLETKRYNWDKFRQLAKLDKKYDETLTAYYEDFTAMCRKICGRATSEDLRKLNGSQIEEISDDRASKLIQRIKLLKKIREEVLVHDKLKERLELCQLSIDLPRWWKSGKHDKALLDGVAKHGLGRTEYQVLLDPDSVFKELVDKIQRPSKIKSESTSSDSSHGLLMNGEHPLGGELPTTAKKISVDSSDENGGRLSSEFKMVVPMHTNEYAQLLSSWPKEKGIVTHLDKICSCVLKGEWPKPPKMETNPMVTKLPAFTRPLVSTVGHFTSAELTTEKSDGIRGEMVANRDFKVKSIDGLKLTVKTDNRIIKTDNSKKRKRKLEAEQGSTNEDSGLQTASGKTTKVNNEPRDPNKSDDVKPLQKKKVEEMCDKETSNKIPSSSIQIHIPKSGNTTVNTTSVSTKSSSNPIIYIPSTVKIPKVSAIIVSSLSNKLKTSNASSRAIVNTVSVLKTTGTRLTSDRKPTVVKVMNDKTLRLKKSTPAADVKIPSKGSDQPVGIHINSPNANVRIQGSKIEVKEKPTNVKREIDLTEVILKVPDPSRFLTKETKKKTVKPVKPFSKPLILPPDENKYSSVPAKPCDHKREVNNKPSTNLKEKKPNVPPPTTSTSGPELRRRPERTAKKRAKDSISEITEAEHRPIDKGELRETLSTPLSPPRREWREIHSPPPQRLAHSREHYVDYYPDRSPSRRSPDIHRYPPPRSPPVHYRLMSPERRSPPLHAIQGRPLSPLRHRHSHSPTPPPPRHIHSPLMREHEEHVKHLHYTEPLSPRYRAGERESPYFYSERSHSPYYYDYRHDKDRFYDELERRSPPLKHRRLASPVREIISPGSHKHGGFIHVPSEVMSPGNHRPPSHTQRELHSPNIKEGRFPYGRVDWDKSRYRHENVNSPPMRSSPVESQFQYQPLSRSIPKEDASSRKNIKSPFSQRDRVEHRSTSRDSLPSHRDDYTNLNISSHDSRHTVPEIRRTGLSPNETRLSVVSQQDVRRSVVSSPRNTRRNTITSQETRKTVISPQEKPRLVVSPHEARRNVISPHETRRQTVVSPYDVRNTTQCPNRRVSKETPPLPKSYSPPPAKSTTSHQSKESRTEHSLETAAKKTKLVERPVIEIPEETVRMSIERKTPATRKKGILEMKIQGLKSKMQQSGISEKIKEKMDAATATTAPASTSELPPKNRNSNNSRSGQTREQPMRVIKSLSDVINSLSNNEKNKVRSLPPETNSKPALELYSPKPSKRTKSLADITSTLAKSLEKSQGTVDSGPKDRPEKPVGRTRSSISMSEGEKNIVTSAKAKPFSSSKLSDVISNLKEKSKAASSALPESKYKAISLSSRPANDSKLMDMLKQSAVSRPLRSKSQFSSVTGDETVKTTNTSKQEIDTRNSPEETYTTRPAQNIIVRSPRTRRSSREERRLASPEVANAQRVTSPRFVKSQSTRTRSPSDLKSPTQLVSLSDGKLLQVTPSSSGKSNRMGAQSDVKSPFAGKSTSRVTSPTAVRSSPQVISPFEVTSPKSPVIPGNVATNTRKLPTTDSILASKMGSERALSPLKSIDVTNVNESECPSPTMPFIEETCGKVESPTAHVMLPVISVPVLRNTPSRRSSLTSPPPLIKSPPPLIKSPTLVRSPEMKSPTNRISPLSTLPLSRTTSLNREEVKGSPHLLHRTTPDPSSLQKIGSAKVPSLVKIPSPNPETSSIANSPVYEKTLQTPKHEELDPRSPEYPRSPPIISTHITSTTLVKPTAVIPKLSVDTKPLGLKDSNNLKLSCTSDSIVPHIMSKETRTSSEGKSDYMLQTNHEPSISTENKLEIDAGTEKVSFNPHKPISKQVTKKQSNEHCSIVVNANTKPIKDRNPEKINKTNTQNEMGAVITAKHSAPEERITVSVELSSAVENTKDNCSETREKKTIIPDKSSVCTETTNTRADESSSSMETKTATLEGHSFNTLSKTTNDYTRSTSTESNQICDSAAANTKTKAIIMETQSVYTELKSTDANASAPIEPTKTEKNTEVTGRKSPELQSFTKKN